jgi:hypothetical protein
MKATSMFVFGLVAFALMAPAPVVLANYERGHAEYWIDSNGILRQHSTPLTGSNTRITSFVASARGLFMVANNGGPNQVWQYTGTPGIWTPITGENTNVASIRVVHGRLLMVANNGSHNHLWEYTGTPGIWNVVPG